MARSKFLPFQDADGDGLLDVCVEEPEVVPEGCPKCEPNPKAIVSDWRKRKMWEPLLNEKICKYQITKETKHTTTNAPEGATPEEAASALKKIYDQYSDIVLKAFLDINNKDTSDETVDLAKTFVEYTDWYLDTRPKSRLKLLYSIPVDALDEFPEADSEEEDEEADEGTDIEVTYEASELESKLLRVRKGLYIYNRNLKVYRAVDNSNILFKEDNSLFNLEDYGDYGTLNGSIMAKILPELDDYLLGKGFNIPFAGKLGPLKETVGEMTFRFDKNYELKKLMVYSKACPGDPEIYIEGLNGLKSKSAWKDPTAMAYFAALSDMDNDLTSQVPLEWTEFIQKYTYPEVHAIANYGYDDEIGDDGNGGGTAGVGSCIGNALRDEAKQLGQDILDEAFSLGDAIAYRFHKLNICSFDIEKARELDRKMGIAPPIEFNNELVGMAQMQAFQALADSNPIAAWLCQALLGAKGTIGSPFGFSDIRILFDNGKICFLLEMLLGAIECLFSGIDFEASLATLAASALKAIGIEDFGKLFKGLPADEQRKLEELVNAKLASSLESDDVSPAAIVTAVTPPWEDEKILEWERANMMESSFNGMTPSSETPPEQPTERTLAPSYDSAEQEAETTTIMQAYADALIEHYKDRLLELIDLLMVFPGAEVIAWALAIIDFMTCPIPPGPGWRWNVGLALSAALPNPCPGCFNGFELTIPRLRDIIIPPWKDILKYLFMLLKWLIQQLIIKILMMLLVKLCELLADAICKAMALAGKAVAALATGGDLKGLIREAICGDDVDDETLDNTIVQLFSTLGTGGASLSDQEQVLSFAQDISSAVTRTEMSEAFLGNPSPAFLGVVDGLIEHEYPDFRSGLKNTEGISSMFKNMGNLMPANFRQQLREFVESLPANDEMPANPSLCATPAELEEFCDVRSSLLAGRASADQIAKLCEISTDDLGDLATIMQSVPKYIDDNMPPMLSDPGCDNGLLPFEPDEIAEATTAGLSAEFQILKSQFSTDMMGNGPMERNWGMLNLILSDTMGNPLTAHHRKASTMPQYVNFYVDPNSEAAEAESVTTAVQVMGVTFQATAGPSPIPMQKGAYPKKVASWLQKQLGEMTIEFSSNNSYQNDLTYTKTFDDFGGPFVRPNFLSLPDLGYNIDIEVDYETENVLFIKKGRKSDPDVILCFEDNAKGLKSGDNGGQSEYSYGFDVEMYLSDLVGPDEENEDVRNRIGDNVRIQIINKLNTSADLDVSSQSMIANVETSSTPVEEKIIKDLKYEFLSTDNTLEGIDFGSEFPDFLSSFEVQKGYLPQVILFREIINNQNSEAKISNQEVKEFHDTIMSSILTTIANDVKDNEAAFEYGAKFDDLTSEDAEYVIDPGVHGYAAGTPYSDVKIPETITVLGREIEYERGLRNIDMIFGKSYNQYINEQNETPHETRVFYLDPTIYGGSYINPAIYIKPLKNEGWLGFLDVLFPEMCPCKPKTTELVDFGQIQDIIDDTYPNIPDDERLKQEVDCITELPYNRVLERAGTAALQGLITAAIRIYATAHMTKTMATFTKFSPRFPGVFSSVYASYIVENMEESFKDAQPDAEEAFTVFKDDEFWYAFLEQSVQMFGRLIEDGEITPSDTALQALIRLNDMQEEYERPTKDDLKDAKRNNEVRVIKTLKNYREDKNLEAIRESEEDAKLILKELVNQELNFIGEKFTNNLETIGMVPDVYDLDYYLLENLTQGSTLNIDHAPSQTYDVEGAPGDTAIYTYGEEFVVGEARSADGEYIEGEEYIGYYHVTLDDDGNILYMAGEFPEEDYESVDVLLPMASVTSIKTGNVENYPFTASSSTTQPFVIEKYVSINGRKTTQDEAQTEIKSNNPGDLISDVYPGTMQLVYDEHGNEVGIEGELGIRYGLMFSVVIGDQKYELTSVEIDALDTTVGGFRIIKEDGKLLVCLVNQLKKDDTFKLVSRYIVALPHLTALTAIYNDMAFLPSIGEVTAADGETYGPLVTPTAPIASQIPFLGTNALNMLYANEKPGTYVKTVEEDDGSYTSEIDDERGIGGWASVKDRSPGFFGGLFVTEWDNWDQVTLSKSTRQIKKLFRRHYYNRDFDISETSGKKSQGGQLSIKNLSSKLKPGSGGRILPWWRKRRLRTNPFNANGELCESED